MVIYADSFYYSKPLYVSQLFLDENMQSTYKKALKGKLQDRKCVIGKNETTVVPPDSDQLCKTNSYVKQ